MSLIGDGAGEDAVTPPRSCVAVGGQPHIAVPVFKIAQLAGIDLVHRLAVHHAVLAAPYAVVALRHKIHVWYAARHGNGACLGDACIFQNTHYHKAVRVRGVDHIAAVQPFPLSRESGNRHAVILRKSHANTGACNFQVGGGDRRPHAAVGGKLLERRRIGGCIHPQLAVFRPHRRLAAHGVTAVFRSVLFAQRHRHLAGRFHLVLHTAVLAELLRVQPFFVRPDQQIGAHGNELLGTHSFRRGQLHIDLIIVVYQLCSVHPCHGIFCDDALRTCQRCHFPPRLARTQQRISLSCQVLHVPPFSVADLPVVVVAKKGVDRLAAGGRFLQFRQEAHARILLYP